MAEADLNRLLGTLRYLRGLAAARARFVQAAAQQKSAAAAEQPAPAQANGAAGGPAGERRPAAVHSSTAMSSFSLNGF